MPARRRLAPSLPRMFAAIIVSQPSRRRYCCAICFDASVIDAELIYAHAASRCWSHAAADISCLYAMPRCRHGQLHAAAEMPLHIADAAAAIDAAIDVTSPCHISPFFFSLMAAADASPLTTICVTPPLFFRLFTFVTLPLPLPYALLPLPPLAFAAAAHISPAMLLMLLLLIHVSSRFDERLPLLYDVDICHLPPRYLLRDALRRYADCFSLLLPLLSYAI